MELTLNNLNETLNRSQANYLAQVSIELTEGANDSNDTMKRVRCRASSFPRVLTPRLMRS